LELYADGLTKYPNNFDLAYNKARLELEIATHPALVKHLDVPLNDLLQQALSSHQYALGLNSQNADLLFNISQVLTTIAEQIAKANSISDVEAVRYLEQALEYQSKCLKLQELNFTESRDQHERALQQSQDEEGEEDDGGTKLEAGTTSVFEDKQEEEQWVSILEPVTAETLLDTIIAQLGTLTTLCSIINASMSPFDTPLTSVVAPAWIESYSTKIVDGVLSNILATSKAELQPRAKEIELTKAILSSTLLEMAYRLRSIDIQMYKEGINMAFASKVLVGDLSTLAAHARALIAFNGALADDLTTVSALAPVDPSTRASVRWALLSEAQNLLAATSKIPTDDTSLVATTHALRGDISLLLHALSHSPFAYPQAISNQAQLLRNAEVFYRNATKLFSGLGVDDSDNKENFQFRGGVVRVLQQLPGSDHDSTSPHSSAVVPAQAVPGIQSILRDASPTRDDAWRRELLEEMVDEGLIRGQIFGIQ